MNFAILMLETTTSPSDRPTNLPSLHLFRRKGENREHFRHNLAKYCGHFGGERNPGINIETREERLDALEKIDEDIMTCCDVLRNLKEIVS
jgi:hypothetical protein